MLLLQKRQDSILLSTKQNLNVSYLPCLFMHAHTHGHINKSIHKCIQPLCIPAHLPSLFSEHIKSCFSLQFCNIYLLAPNTAFVQAYKTSKRPTLSAYLLVFMLKTKQNKNLFFPTHFLAGIKMASLKPRHNLEPTEAISGRDLELEHLSPLERAHISTLLPFGYVALSRVFIYPDKFPQQ